MADLNVTWIHGSPNCSAPVDPPIQVHRFDVDTFILRQSKCSDPGIPGHRWPSFEAPFMYLLLGNSKALLLDTGVTSSPALFPLAETVGNILRDRANVQGAPVIPLRIVHSHSHPDHIAGDSQFSNAEIAPHQLVDIKTHFGLPHWPDGTATIDLGGRVIDVIPIPGHDETHIALYDRNSQILLTGDTIYPGLLVVEQWGDYARSIARLDSFIATHPVSFVLGAHIEMTNQPGRWFGLGALHQPGEHVLQLTVAHVTELHNALVALGTTPRTKRL